MIENDTNTDETPEEFLEECSECGEVAVVTSGRCKTCLGCGNSLCSL